MNAAVPVREDLFWIGVNDWETERFENIWPLPQGISYNSYLLLDEKTVLIDAVKDNYLLPYLDTLNGSLKQKRAIDYLIINHIEPDHSGAVPFLLERYPGMVIIGNRKTADFLEQFYSIRDNVRVIADGEVLDCGRHKLQFHLTPMVHWPETMMTHDTTDKILFSGDVFGSFGAVDGAVFDDEIADMSGYEDEILRYFANVIGRYSSMAQKALAKVRDLEVEIIASTHGPVWRKEPQRVWSLYDRWSRHDTEPGVVVAYASMYGNTEQMMEAICGSLVNRKAGPVVVHNVSKSHPSYILRDIWRYRALVLGTPTYNVKPFPMIDNLMRLLQNKMMKNRLLALFGSYGWSGGGVKTLMQLAGEEGWQLVEPVVEAHCAPKETDLEQCRLLGGNIARQMAGF